MPHATQLTPSTHSAASTEDATATPLAVRADPHPTGSHLALVALCIVLALSRGLSLMGDANAAVTAAAPVHTPEQVYQMALEARTERDYASMLSLLREAGQAGHLPAQELLASALMAGPNLYGNAVSADPCEAALWTAAAARQGSVVARHLQVVLNGLREMPAARAGCDRANGPAR